MAEKYHNKYRIESNRWPYWDYSAPGSYFITICTQNRSCIFGTISAGKMILSAYGEIVENEFLKIPTYHQRAGLDAHVVMPNHVHCIITLGDDNAGDGGGGDVEKIHEFSLPEPRPHHHPQSWWHNPNHHPTDDEIKQYRKQRRRMIIPKLLGKFQMITSKQINLIRHTPGTKNWQPNYHDHFIRDSVAYYRIKRYIRNNPENWKGDTFHR